MPPSPIQMPVGTLASELGSAQPAVVGGQPSSLPQSPGRSSFLPSFMRRPRALTGDSFNGPPSHISFDRSQPLSSESLLNGPSSPSGGTTSRRRMGGLPSPPLSSSREDPLVNFGQRLIRRISNQGGSTSSPATAAAATPSRQVGPQRSMSTPPVAHGRTPLIGGSEHVYDERDERRGSVAQANGEVGEASASAAAAPASAVAEGSSSNADASSSRPVHRLRLVPLLEASNSLPFDPVVRDVPETFDPTLPGAPSDTPSHTLRIGRFTDKQSGVDGVPRGGALTSNKVAFKSKVVSRIHAELWVIEGGRFFVRDTKSSSGTFLNHQRLSPPGQESRPFAIKDGDILQLGVDYQGGTEEIYKCVKMRAEIGRGWQTGANSFNTAALKQLQALGGAPSSPATGKGKKIVKASVTDCCICLFSVTICQSLFIAPCSHVFHYKCIRPLLEQHHPGFSCPVCRSFADLEADVETEDAFDMASRRESLLSRRGSLKSVKAAFDQGLAEALGVASPDQENGNDDEDEGEGAQGPQAEAVVWDGGLTPGVGLTTGYSLDGSFPAAAAAPGASVPPIAETVDLPTSRTLDLVEAARDEGAAGTGRDLSPAESVRAAAQLDHAVPVTTTTAPTASASAAANNPSSASLTDGGGLSPPAVLAVVGDGAKGAGETTSTASPDAVKDSPLLAGVDGAEAGQGSGSSSADDNHVAAAASQ